MTIPMLGGFGDSLAPVSQALAGIVDKKLHPNRHLEEVMQQAFAQNPELLQKFADLEKNAPGTAEALGLGRLSNIINFIPESQEQELKKSTKGKVAQATNAKLDAETAKDTFTVEDMEGFRQYLKSNPNATVDMYKKRATGATGVEQETQEVELQGKKIKVNAETRSEDLIAHLPPVVGVQMVQDANLLLLDPSKVPADRLASYLSNPVYQPAFSALVSAGSAKINNAQQNRQIDIAAGHLDVARQNAKTAEDNSANRGGSPEKFKMQQAQEAYEKSGYVGTLEAWTKLLYDADSQARATGLLDGSITATTVEDQALKKAAEARKGIEDYKTLTQAVSINKAVSTAMTNIDKANSDGERTIQLQAMNSLLDQRARLGGERIQASWRDPMFGAGRVEFKDAKGNVLDPEQIGSLLADPEATDVMQSHDVNVLSTAAASVVDAIKKSKNPSQALSQLKMQDFSPDKSVTKQAEAQLRKEGIIK